MQLSSDAGCSLTVATKLCLSRVLLRCSAESCIHQCNSLLTFCLLSSLRAKAFFAHEQKRVEYFGLVLKDNLEQAATVARRLNKDSATRLTSEEVDLLLAKLEDDRVKLEKKGNWELVKTFFELEERFTFKELLGPAVPNVEVETFVSSMIAADQLKPRVEQLTAGTSLLAGTEYDEYDEQLAAELPAEASGTSARSHSGSSAAGAAATQLAPSSSKLAATPAATPATTLRVPSFTPAGTSAPGAYYPSAAGAQAPSTSSPLPTGAVLADALKGMQGFANLGLADEDFEDDELARQTMASK